MIKTHMKKKDLIEKCKQILYSHNIRDTLQGSELNFMKELLKHHYKYYSENPAQIVIGVNEYNKRLKEFRFINDKGEEISFSYRKCISDSSINKNNIIRAFRHAINPQIKEYKNKLFAKGDVYCEISGAKLTWDNCHIDHKIKFRDLLNNFLKLKKLKYNDIVIINNSNELPDIKDQALLHEWCEYHKTHAILRPLHKTINLKLH